MYSKSVIIIVIATLGVPMLLGGMGFLAIQFIHIDKSNPPVVREPNWDLPQTRLLMERACFDCHSNETNWPWYSNIAPVSWLVVEDVRRGRAKLNFSEWDTFEGGIHKEGASNEDDEFEARGEEEPEAEKKMIKELGKGKMPPKKYLLVHPEARLTQAELETLIRGIKATFGPTDEGALHMTEGQATW